jgi:hypothetical protein
MKTVQYCDASYLVSQDYLNEGDSNDENDPNAVNFISSSNLSLNKNQEGAFSKSKF